MALENNVPLLTHDHSGTGARATNQLLAVNTHGSPDTDNGSTSLHHTLGPGSYQAASGAHLHAGQYIPVEFNTFARYFAPASQNIPNTVDTVVWFPNANSTSSLVVPAAFGSGTSFNLRRAGIWNISTTVRYHVLASGGGETYIAINSNGVAIAANGGSSSNAVNTRSCSTTDFLGFNSNVTVTSWIAQITGTAAGATTGGFPWTYISLNWLHD